MTFSPFVSFRYNSVPSPSLDHVLYVHSRSYCTFPIIFLMHLSFVFFPGTTLHRGISGSKCPALGLAFTKAFSFPCASTGLHTLCFFFPAQHCIGRSLDSNDHHWEMHSVRPGFHFPGLLLDCTQCKFSFFKAQRCIGRSLDPNDHMWDTHHLGFSISVRFFWTAHSPDFNK